MLNELNDSQREAATHIDGPLLILAGAGSGKTKTLTTRLAYLIGEVGIDPINTLTLTFTNKAASEMRQRALNLIDSSAHSMPLLCTFHKFGLLFLKLHIEKLGRKNSFNIIDSDDQKRMIKAICKDFKIDLQTSFLTSEISKYKNILLEPQEVTQKAELSDYKKAAQVYTEYQKRLLENNLVDFDDLLSLTYKILLNNNELRVETSKKYQYIMVDEYQDTNELQYQLLKLLSSEHNNICVVGDDDQSIYGWRGANIRNILEFHQHFEGAKIVKLEINYRSTQQILNAANTLIEHNRKRLGKKLESFLGDGESVKLQHSIDEVYEANSIAQKIQDLINKGVEPNNIAVLYRINALSRSLEEGFTKAGLAFKMIGGIRFYERAEIKDIISYLRLVSNSNDDFSLLRIINKPKRGIGAKSLEKIRHFASSKNKPIFTALEEASSSELSEILSKKAINSLKDFIDIINRLKQESIELGEMITVFDHLTGLREYYEAMADGFDRVLNMDEFYGYFRDAIYKDLDLTLEQFLSDITLQSDQDQVDGEAVNIMSVHASKGLEFEHLFVIGMEEEFFPLISETTDMEEERRLAYVAFTRAKKELTLCYIDSRFYRGQRKNVNKSRFLGEAGLIKNSSLKLSKSADFKRGDLVKHKIFGIGRVQEVTKSGKEYKLKINFGGNKKEILSSFVEPAV
jgi:DNA helicase-2/ATP-dependent DNA helicase PcrA